MKSPVKKALMLIAAITSLIALLAVSGTFLAALTTKTAQPVEVHAQPKMAKRQEPTIPNTNYAEMQAQIKKLSLALNATQSQLREMMVNMSTKIPQPGE